MTDPHPVTRDYEIIEELGRGSFAWTYRCVRKRDGATVAIKELRLTEMGNFDPLDLFEREARVLAALDHPSIPKVYEAFEGTTSAGALAFYLVQELVEGRSLATRIDAGPMLGEDDLFHIASKLLQVLDYLHSRLPPVLHRDIKPSNIIIRPDGSPALIDFGGVCFGWRPPNQTGTTVVGTFGYMPPEQLLGQVGRTADLYALGATLLHTATGISPHEFSFDTGQFEVPDDLPVRSELKALIRALLRPAPKRRPQTPAEALEILAGQHEASSQALATVSNLAGPNALVPVQTVSFVDAGPPPRDPDGVLADVYQNLMNDDPHQVRAPVWAHIVLGVLSLGLVQAITLHARRTRKRRYHNLFCRGESTIGTLIERSGMTNYKYQYEVDGQTYRAVISYAIAFESLSIMDKVGVIYNPQNPQESGFVYRRA